ncbi:hypothetical protein UA08_07191 [Talaromyces atroroseus]|uniref:Protein kinase domain-containing protein n=1 Tax=Talaromyces atroroseus TaxID=1441469 RepID=A0A225AKT1_TALAT|nr:hypothetical protein UA08_07191 [Talaromyces atroroseus]OKL57838.1 hypothetical protein UA08_07191 [Talaromyces atroroseus]
MCHESERQTGIHNCEVRAYRRLMQNGLGHQGIVPRYYREIQHLDVKDYQPHLRRFLDEERPPSAIFLEYIPNMMTILPERYTKERIESMIHGIQQIHKALVLHFDSYPRNIMVFEDDPGRVIWIDFDRAQTYDADTITERNRRWIQEEEEDVHVFGESMKEDHALGKMWNTLPYY